MCAWGKDQEDDSRVDTTLADLGPRTRNMMKRAFGEGALQLHTALAKEFAARLQSLGYGTVLPLISNNVLVV